MNLSMSYIHFILPFGNQQKQIGLIKPSWKMQLMLGEFNLRYMPDQVKPHQREHSSLKTLS